MQPPPQPANLPDRPTTPAPPAAAWRARWQRARPRLLPILFWVGIFVVLCLLRWPIAERWFHDVDESVSVLIANAWLDGGIPYRDAIDQRGPITYLIYAAVFAVAGRGNMDAVHGALLLLIFASCWLTDRLARQLVPADRGAAVGWVAALLLAVCTFTYKRTQLLAFHTEWPTMVLSLLGMWFTWRAVSARSNPGGHGVQSFAPLRDLLLAGLCFGLSFLAKQPAVFDGAAAGGFLLLVAALDGRLWRRQTLLDALVLAGGFFVAVLAAVGYFAAHGALADAYLYFWSYNVEHYTAVVPIADRLAALNPWDHSRHYLRANPLLFAGVVIQIARVAVELVRRWRRRSSAKTEGSVAAGWRGRLLLVAWLICGYFGASYSGRNFGHYFIQIIAPACLLTASLLVDLWRTPVRGETAAGPGPAGPGPAGPGPAGPGPAGPGPWTGALRASLVWVTLVSLIMAVYPFRRDMAIFAFRRAPRVDVTVDKLVAVVGTTTRPGDTMFVWGYYPELYLLADRQPASRYSNTNYLTGMLPWENHRPKVDTSAHIVPGAWDILLRELAAKRPVVIVDTAPGNHRSYGKYPISKFPQLADYLDRHYQHLTSTPDRRGKPYFDVYLLRESAGGGTPTPRSVR